MTDIMLEYDADGRILRHGYCQSGLAMYVHPLNGGTIWMRPFENAEEIYAVIDPNLHFFDPASEEILHRPVIGRDDAVSIPADGEFEVRIPVIENTVVMMHDEEFVIGPGDDQFVFSTDEPGVYRFEVTPPFPYRPFQIEVTANEV